MYENIDYIVDGRNNQTTIISDLGKTKKDSIVRVMYQAENSPKNKSEFFDRPRRPGFGICLTDSCLYLR